MTKSLEREIITSGSKASYDEFAKQQIAYINQRNMVGLSKKLIEGNVEELKLHRLSGTIFKSGITPDEKKDILSYRKRHGARNRNNNS